MGKCPAGGPDPWKDPGTVRALAAAKIPTQSEGAALSVAAITHLASPSGQKTMDMEKQGTRKGKGAGKEGTTRAGTRDEQQEPGKRGQRGPREWKGGELPLGSGYI